MKHGVRTFFLLLMLGLTACEPWNLEPRSFPKCDAPAATISAAPNLLTVQFGLVNLTGTADAIQWNFGDGNTSTVFTINHPYARPGTYPVTARVTNICGDELLLNTTVAVSNAVLPTVTTATPDQFTTNSARIGLTINSLGNDVVTAYGVLISPTQSVPTLANSTGVTGTGTPAAGQLYSLTRSGLVRGQTYYVRGYATNRAGTGYGEVKSFVL